MHPSRSASNPSDVKAAPNEEEAEFAFYDPTGLSSRRRSSVSPASSSLRKEKFPWRSTSSTHPPTLERSPSQTLVRNMSERLETSLSVSEQSSYPVTLDSMSIPPPPPPPPSSHPKPQIPSINTSVTYSPNQPRPMPASSETSFPYPLSNDDHVLSRVTSNAHSSRTDDSADSLSYTSTVAWSPAVEFLSSFVDDSKSPSTHSNPNPTDDEDLFSVPGYTFGRSLGHGAFSVVREAVNDNTGEKVAVKIIKRSNLQANTSVDPSTSSRRASVPPTASTEAINELADTNAVEYAGREAHIWSNLEPHKHIVPILSICHDHFATYIFMPLYAGGNLLQFINATIYHPVSSGDDEEHHPRRRDPSTSSSTRKIHVASSNSSQSQRSNGLRMQTVKFVFHQLVRGLAYLHTKAFVIHNDIKLENILIGDDGIFRIADFGLASINRPPPGKSSPYQTSPTSRVDSNHSRQQQDTQFHIEGSTESQFPSLSSPPQPPSPPVPSDIAEGPSSFPDQQILGNPSRTSQDAHSVPVNAATDAVFAAGSLQYCPPEQIQAVSESPQPSVDIWALGCILYALFTGKLPFDDDYEPRLRVKIVQGDWEIPWYLTDEAMTMDRSTEEDREERRAALEVLRGCLEMRVGRRWRIGRIARSTWIGNLMTEDDDILFKSSDGDGYESGEEEEYDEFDESEMDRGNDESGGEERIGRKRVREMANVMPSPSSMRPHSTQRSMSSGRRSENFRSPSPALYRAHGRGRRRRSPSSDMGSSSQRSSRSQSRTGRKRDKSSSASRERRRDRNASTSRSRLSLNLERSGDPAPPVITPTPLSKIPSEDAGSVDAYK